ncbi:2-oxo acid dehydrogenase subunit E2 [Gordonia sp. zg691]|uniref:dihydrolipoamide acetyltransferase family protein n=1 Tax=Gordonia jinghuaiqii TaxID=2758710 RepID=UPI001662767B|nr:dihydrolipoamide acetyltransferase family protein [Gordonia jinghuaiqii]MBD0860891.1 2-oxo acid dehydrogenase subunit E2 [Gordonia jinghuaiqii]
MTTITRFKLPDVGEGLTEAEVLEWRVAVGEEVEVNQIVCEIETAKSAVELPSPVRGTVEEIHVAEGETVDVGTVILSVRSSRRSGVATRPDSEAVREQANPVVEADPGAAGHAPMLVGSGPIEPIARTRFLRPRTGGTARTAVRTAGVPGEAGLEPAEAVVEPEIRIPIRGVRKAMVSAMTYSAFTAPHASEWIDVDMTETMALTRSLRDAPGWEDVRISPMAVVARALVTAIGRNPEINSRWDGDAQEIVRYRHVNLGVAAATPRGLVVPNVKGAESLSFRELITALGELIATARAGRVRPAQMEGGTVTLTNIGALGMDGGTPILNPGEAAILAFGAVRPTPWVVGDRVEIREVARLTLAFDHRLVDGELGARVLTDVAAVLRSPVSHLLHH